MTTSNPTHDTAAPTGRRRAPSSRAAESRTGARDAGRKPTTRMVVVKLHKNMLANHFIDKRKIIRLNGR